jgi:hypothetical protein
MRNINTKSLPFLKNVEHWAGVHSLAEGACFEGEGFSGQKKLDCLGLGFGYVKVGAIISELLVA